ncbi:CLUMA_CG020789, isoform A [Clunio marinus]|uniref:CLUMA_CG020789, isoform A n=1 Tax=Clunio marinus TaxID=568069 RepID=A0A1J1J602_9DIPT|nr:CLUMA_CG020789, isoform A [Clunio marinus]
MMTSTQCTKCFNIVSVEGLKLVIASLSDALKFESRKRNELWVKIVEELPSTDVIFIHKTQLEP